MNLDQGLRLIQIAGEIAPPLAKLIGEALGSHSTLANSTAPLTAEDAALVSRVLAALPERSKTRDALDALGGDTQ